MKYWLFKSEPDEFSFDDLKKRKAKTEPWNGVRNYQARNFMRDEMAVGDVGLFYHSNTATPGIAGVVMISKPASPDPTQFDPASDYYDAGSPKDAPRWLLVHVTWKADFKHFISLPQLKEEPGLEDMLILRRGNRLSITPVSEEHFDLICQLGGLEKR